MVKFARYIPCQDRADYESAGWRIIDYQHPFLRGVLAVRSEDGETKAKETANAS